MDRQAQIDFILDHYESPRNRGVLDDATIIQKGINPACGDVITLYIRVGDGERIEAVRFEGEGCTFSQAAASIATEMILGKTITQVTELPVDRVVDLLGRDLVASRLRCATLGINTIREAVQRYRNEPVGGLSGEVGSW